ncbi:hypothetical protein Q669_17615 [Labrenzia sp. C1B10]|nr:hypothetical protein Q669_17615 [Labrenzia sp. C1B10]ERS07108.1 hypothetical protein Q675_23245 [Labrenzia sp. C1B70]
MERSLKICFADVIADAGRAAKVSDRLVAAADHRWFI